MFFGGAIPSDAKKIQTSTVSWVHQPAVSQIEMQKYKYRIPSKEIRVVLEKLGIFGIA